jgi:hypothetical protein
MGSETTGEQMKNTVVSFLFLILLCASSLISFNTLTDGHHWGGDFSQYIMQARSIIAGVPAEVIEENRIMLQQSSSPPFCPLVYPWGLPVLLAPFYAAFGADIFMLKLPGFIFYLLFLCTLYWGFRKYHSFPWLFVLILFCSLNPETIRLLNDIGSDIPFLFFSTICLVFIRRIIVERRYILSSTWDPVLLGAFIAMAFFIRTNGFLLLPALGFAQLAAAFQHVKPEITQDRNRFRNLVSSSGTHRQDVFYHFGPYLVFIILVMLWHLVLPEGGSSHFEHLKWITPDILCRNFVLYSKLFSRIFSTIPKGNLVFWITVPLSIWGFCVRYRSDHFIAVYIMLTFSLYIIWPHQPAFRFILPVMPFYISFVFTGLEELGKFSSPKWRVCWNTVCIVSVLLILSWFGWQAVRGAYHNLQQNRKASFGPYKQSSMEMFSFIKKQTDPESTVIFFKPRVMRMMTGRKSVRIIEANRLSRADYLCMFVKDGAEPYKMQITHEELRSLFDQGKIQLVYENKEFKVYRLTDNKKNNQSGYSLKRGSALIGVQRVFGLCHEKRLYSCPGCGPFAEEKNIEDIHVANGCKHSQGLVIIPKGSKDHHGNPVQKDNTG